jgi:alkyl sulfatase BDS1-like metallo-beta-lactamase superfamily hydrolase
MNQPAIGEASKETPKAASHAVIAQHEAMLKALPFDDTTDFDDAARGFLGTIENARITSPRGRLVFSLEPYGFLSDPEPPTTVNPSLWRQARLNMQHGLFEVVPGVYQVRGFDIANMTLIEGDNGVIVVDTLTSIEGGRGDGALLQAPRLAGGCGRHLYPYPHRPLGRRARRIGRGPYGRREGPDHRPEPFPGARGL